MTSHKLHTNPTFTDSNSIIYRAYAPRSQENNYCILSVWASGKMRAAKVPVSILQVEVRANMRLVRYF